MCHTLREEFRLKKFGFGYEEAEDFCVSIWNVHPFINIVIRLMMSVYTAAVLVYNLVIAGVDSYIYLTIWSYTVLTLHVWLSTILSIYGVIRRRKKPHSLSISSTTNLNEYDFTSAAHYGTAGATNITTDCDISAEGQNRQDEQPDERRQSHTGINTDKTIVQSETHKTREKRSINIIYVLSWLLSDVIHVFAIIVTLIYWIFLYPALDLSNSTSVQVFNDVNVHAFNSVFILIDIFLCARPVRVLHLIYPTIYGGIYTTWALIYWLEDKENHIIYSVLDFNNPGVVVLTVVGLGLVIIPVLQLFHFGIYRFKLHIKHHRAKDNVVL